MTVVYFLKIRKTVFILIISVVLAKLPELRLKKFLNSLLKNF